MPESWNLFLIILVIPEEHADEGGSYPDLMDLVEDTDKTVKAYDDNNDGLIHYGEFYRNHQVKFWQKTIWHSGELA